LSPPTWKLTGGEISGPPVTHLRSDTLLTAQIFPRQFLFPTAARSQGALSQHLSCPRASLHLASPGAKDQGRHHVSPKDKSSQRRNGPSLSFVVQYFKIRPAADEYTSRPPSDLRVTCRGTTCRAPFSFHWHNGVVEYAFRSSRLVLNLESGYWKRSARRGSDLFKSSASSLKLLYQLPQPETSFHSFTDVVLAGDYRGAIAPGNDGFFSGHGD
jgi:hypothetical protein